MLAALSLLVPEMQLAGLPEILGGQFLLVDSSDVEDDGLRLSKTPWTHASFHALNIRQKAKSIIDRPMASPFENAATREVQTKALLKDYAPDGPRAGAVGNAPSVRQRLRTRFEEQWQRC